MGRLQSSYMGSLQSSALPYVGRLQSSRSRSQNAACKDGDAAAASRKTLRAKPPSDVGAFKIRYVGCLQNSVEDESPRDLP